MAFPQLHFLDQKLLSLTKFPKDVFGLWEIIEQTVLIPDLLVLYLLIVLLAVRYLFTGLLKTLKAWSKHV